MATTSSTLAASKANGGIGQRGNGNGFITKLATGAAILGCAAALALGGLRASEGAQSSPVASAAREDVRGRQLLLESNLLPDGGAMVPIGREQWRFLEENVQLPGGTLPVIDRTQHLFLELNINLPDGTFGRLSTDQFRFLESNLLPDGDAPRTNPSSRSTFR